MADLKISELTNLTAADPANDMIPIVDVSATPPASGSTKRISINNILACSPTATLASATITGDLTVDTSTLKVDSANNRVGVNTATPSYPLHVLTNAVSGRFNLSNIDRTTANWARITNPQYAMDASAGLILRPFPDSDLRQGAGIIASGGTNNGDTNVALFVSSGVASSTSFAAYATTIAGSDVSHNWYQSAGSTSMTLNSTGLNIANGNVILGTSGKGIDFSATASGSGTMTSELLSDYEEGTFTPTITNGFTTPGYSLNAGRYTKVGRICYFAFRVAVNTGTRNANILEINLPFTSINDSSQSNTGGAWFSYVNAVVGSTTTNLPALYNGANTNSLQIIKTDLLINI